MSNWQWKGPYETGISQSLINNFLVCPYRFYLYYGLGLEEPRPVEPNLIWGNMMHRVLELSLLIDKPISDLLDDPGVSEQYMKELATYVDPLVPMSAYYPMSVLHMLRLYDDSFKNSIGITEEEFKTPYNTGKNQVYLIGKRDYTHPELLVDHKCKGRWDPHLGPKELIKDVQLIMYLHGTDTERVIYDVIIIPEAQYYQIPRRTGEKMSSWYNRIYTTHAAEKYPICRNKSSWLYQHPVTITKRMQRQVFLETINPIIDRICTLYDHCNRPDFDPDVYDEIYYKVPIRHFDPGATEQYKGPYHEHMLGNLERFDLTPVPKLFKELTHVDN